MIYGAHPCFTYLAQGSLGSARVEGPAVGVGVATMCVGVAMGPGLNVATSSGTSTASHHPFNCVRRDSGAGSESTLQVMEDEAA